MDIKYNGKPTSVRKMTEEDKRKMEGWAKKANEDKVYRTQLANVNRRACARRHYQSKELTALY